jgi:hypothetical protein
MRSAGQEVGKAEVHGSVRRPVDKPVNSLFGNWGRFANCRFMRKFSSFHPQPAKGLAKTLKPDASV